VPLLGDLSLAGILPRLTVALIYLADDVGGMPVGAKFLAFLAAFFVGLL
jgi:hypothetical protein